MEEKVLELKENGDLTDNIISKSDAHKNGICHGISAVALISNGKLLIQKRSLRKRGEPGKWDLSSAGHIDLDETPIDAAIREVYEEIGILIDKSELELIDTFLMKKKFSNGDSINHFTYLYVVKKNIDLNSVIMQETEVDEVMLVDKKEYMELFDNGCMVEGIKYCGRVLDYIN